MVTDDPFSTSPESLVVQCSVSAASLRVGWPYAFLADAMTAASVVEVGCRPGGPGGVSAGAVRTRLLDMTIATAKNASAAVALKKRPAMAMASGCVRATRGWSLNRARAGKEKGRSKDRPLHFEGYWPRMRPIHSLVILSSI